MSLAFLTRYAFARLVPFTIIILLSTAMPPQKWGGKINLRFSYLLILRIGEGGTSG
jgi:hypothetical protein